MNFDSCLKKEDRVLVSRREALVGAIAVLLPGVTSAATSTFQLRRIAVTARGQGPDVLFIPGLAAGPRVWSGSVAALTGYRCHLVHVRGFDHLAADRNGSGPLLEPIAAEIARYIAATGMKRPAIIGHSMGGTLGLMVALRQRASIARVMVVDMLPDGAAMLGGTSGGLGYLAQQLNGYFTSTKAGRRLLADMVQQTPGGKGSDPRVISQALAEIAQRDLTPSLQRLPCPLGVIYAVPPEVRLRNAQAQRYRAAYAGVRGARLTGIGPSGHMVMLDQPIRFTAALKEFLQG